MKKLVFIMLALVLVASVANAQFRDEDGQLAAAWSPPTWGNPVSHYVLDYEINGIQGPVVETAGLLDSTVVLGVVGDWSILSIVAISIFDDTSTVAQSDTAYYALNTGVGPPTGVIWIQP